MKYDVIIVGGGPAGAFAAYELSKLDPTLKIALMDKGRRVEERVCPAQYLNRCIKCRVCSITNGFSGAGAFSDCKLTLYNEDDTSLVGGELEKYSTLQEMKELIDYTVGLYCKFGAPNEVVGGKNEPIAEKLAIEAKEAGLELVAVPIMHPGTTTAHQIFFNLEESIEKNGVDIWCNTEVEDFLIENGVCVGVSAKTNGKSKKVTADRVIVAVGREGAGWLQRVCKKYNIEAEVGAIKVGVRFELPDKTMTEANQLYEGKLKRPEGVGTDAALTFCHNPSGWVVSESYDGGRITLANGHADGNKKSNRTNLALLFKMDLGNNAIDTVKSMARTINIMANGQVMVQRLGDFRENKRTTPEAIKNNSVEPTLKAAVPGNLRLCISDRLFNNLIDFIERIDKVIPGFANPDNIIYGLEAKFSNFTLTLDENMASSIENLHFIGDGCGLTNGLIQASASGIQVARKIIGY